MPTTLKYLLSFLKQDWDLEDYPIRIRRLNEPDSVLDSLQVLWIPCVAQIRYWPRMVGVGNTIEEAYANLRRKFYEYKRAGNKLPRPGARVALQFAPSTSIDKYDHIAGDFFKRILDMDYGRIFISDGSSLGDFAWSGTDILRKRIENTYGIDISDIEDGNLAQIFARISQRVELGREDANKQ